jgi:hypothetical protein
MPAMRFCRCGYRAHGALLQMVVVRQTRAVRPQGESHNGESIPPITIDRREPLLGPERYASALPPVGAGHARDEALRLWISRAWRAPTGRGRATDARSAPAG